MALPSLRGRSNPHRDQTDVSLRAERETTVGSEAGGLWTMPIASSTSPPRARMPYSRTHGRRRIRTGRPDPTMASARDRDEADVLLEDERAAADAESAP